MTYFERCLRQYHRRESVAVKVGDIGIGGNNSIKIQTMTTTDTMDTVATVEETIRCIQAGADLVRITTPSTREAENLRAIKKSLRAQGYTTPLVADVHYTPKAAEIAAQIVEKVRINPGNYVDKKKFAFTHYTDSAYSEEVYKIRDKFLPLLKICQREGTAMRIGVNHGSLSDRIMSRYGDTPIGMVESALEFVRIAREEGFHHIVLSMKSSNPLVMIQAYRLLIETMCDEFSIPYPIHLGVTEAGDGNEGRIKSAIGIGTLLEEGIGDTLRVSLTEDPEKELPVCQALIQTTPRSHSLPFFPIPQDPFSYQRHQSSSTLSTLNLNKDSSPRVLIDGRKKTFPPLASIGYSEIAPQFIAADFLITDQRPTQPLPDGLSLILPYKEWVQFCIPQSYPLFSIEKLDEQHSSLPDTPCFIEWDIHHTELWQHYAQKLTHYKGLPIILIGKIGSKEGLLLRNWSFFLTHQELDFPLIFHMHIEEVKDKEEVLIDFARTLGPALIDGRGDGICLLTEATMQWLLATSFSILQTTRLRISKTEYISCPSCGRTLFNLQEVTQRIRSATIHLKGVKIGVMGCIVNGPGEMADADFGYVGSGKNMINLYKGKEIVRRNVASEVAVEALIDLIKEYGMWEEPMPMINEL